MLSPFVGGTLIFVGVILASTIVKSSAAIFRLNPPWYVTFQWLAYRVPVILTYALPVGVMFATSLLIIRLGRDNEITALRMGGMSIRRFFLPFYVVGLLVSVASLVNNEYLAPRGATRSNEVLVKRILQAPGQAIKDTAAFRSGGSSFCHVSRVDLRAKVLYFVLIYRLEQGLPREALCAARGVREGGDWVLEDVYHHWFDAEGQLVRRVFEERHPVEFANDLVEMWDEDKDPDQLTIREVQDRLKLLERAGDPANSTRMRYYLHTKFAMPLTSLIFTLLAAPLSLRLAKPGSHPFAGLLLTIAVVFFCNGTINWAKAIALSGPQAWMTPGVAAWIHVWVFGGLALLLAARAETKV